jgi:hypothetical protein
MTIKSAAIEVVNSANTRFTNAHDGDLIIYTSQTSQAILIGTNTATQSAILVNGTSVTVNGTLTVNGNTNLTNVFATAWKLNQDVVTPNAYINSSSLAYVSSMTFNSLPNTDVTTLFSGTALTIPLTGVFTISYSIGLTTDAPLSSYFFLDGSQIRLASTSISGSHASGSVTAFFNSGQVVRWNIDSSTSNAIMDHTSTFLSLTLVRS